MKNFADYPAEKYTQPQYQQIEPGIYRIREKFSWDKEEKDVFVTSLTFEQEPEYGEGDHPARITQYPLEDLLDAFSLYVSDFYEEENEKSSCICYQEFASLEVDDIRRLRTVIGKHVYLKPNPGRLDEDGGIVQELTIE